MTLVVEALSETPVAQRRIELVERKGLGHPDTLCDSLVEAISLGLNRMYRERAGSICHYNIDKALLIAGQCAKGFGWGELTQPIELILGDRATFTVNGMRLPVEETARLAVDEWVAAHLPHVRPGKDLKTKNVKILGVRRDDTLALTVAMPFLCSEIGSESAYFRRKNDALAALAERFRDAPFSIEWGLNCLDRPGRGTEGVYLSLTGTSAEDADSGQVGRGNRVNGLIAFSRPTGGEAAPGKNPVAHVGKIYSVLSHRLTRLIHARCPGLLEVYVHLACRIGEPVDHPWTGVQVILPPGMGLADVEGTIGDVVEAELHRMPGFQAELIRGEHQVC